MPRRKIGLANRMVVACTCNSYFMFSKSLRIFTNFMEIGQRVSSFRWLYIFNIHFLIIYYLLTQTLFQVKKYNSYVGIQTKTLSCLTVNVK